MNIPPLGTRAAGLALTLTLSALPGVQAEEEEQQEVETFKVTGTRLETNQIANTTPITQVGSEEFQFQGNARVEDVLRSYPQLYVAQGSGDSNGSTGTATVELRALGTQRTLVLVNGRRLPAGSAQLGGVAPDINQIPGALIERVDIFTGGASAVYGSDALAGVVNFILIDDFEGLRADFQYSEYQHHNDSDRWKELISSNGEAVASGYQNDGDIAQGALIAGFNFGDGRGNLTAYATYRDIEPVSQASRDYSSCGLDSLVTRCLGSSTIPQGRFSDFGLAPLFGGFGPFVGGSSFDYIVDDHDFVDREGATYNYAPLNYFQRQDERYTFGAFARYDLTPELEAYGEFMYMRDRTTSQIAPSGNFFHTFQLSCAHPFLSDAQRQKLSCLDGNGDLIANGQQVVFMGRRNVEGGPRRHELVHASYRGVLGVRGTFSDAWDYDAFAQYAKVELRTDYLNDLSITRIFRALDAVEHNGEVACRSAVPNAQGTVTDPDCVPWNVFQAGAVTPDMVAYLARPLHARGTTDQLVVSGTFSGDLTDYGVKSPFAVNSGRMALGAEFRKESLVYDPDENYRSGDGSGQGGATQAISGDYHVTELFVETHLPLIENLPYAQELVLDAAYRYSDYDYGEHIDTWAFRLGWTINPLISFRGSVQRAVRAPSVQELFLPQRLSLFEMNRDPCSRVTGGTQNADGSISGGVSSSGYSYEQCARTGVTEAQWGKIQDSPANQYNIKSGGNTDLAPEEGKTWTAGIVLSPDLFDGVSLAVDYYKVEIEHVITGLSPTFILSQCLEDDGVHSLCDKIFRGVAGDLWLGSNANGRECTGQESDLSVCLSGHVSSAQDNLAIEATDGIDVTLDIQFDLGRHGTAKLNNVLTHINALDFQAVDGAPVLRCAGNRYCGPTPDLRNRLRLTWETPWDITASLMWRHTSAIAEDRRFSVKIPKMDYVDLALVWEITDDATIHAGINNLADRDPPIIGNSSGSNGNTYPGLYDALGRYLFVGASMEF